MNAEAIKRGRTYITEHGHVRRVDTLEGTGERMMIGWRDPSGATGGRCDITVFSARATREATPDEIRRAERDRH